MSDITKKIIELTVRWYKPNKGFGFGFNDDFENDIFIHFSVLSKKNIVNVQTGDVIKCTIEKGDKGLQIKDIIEVIEGDGALELEDESPYYDSKDIVEASGVVKWFNPVKGFGFAHMEGYDNDVFLHISVLRRIRKESLDPETKIVAKMVKKDKGYEIIQIAKIL